MLSQFARPHRDGNREDYDESAISRTKRVARAAILAAAAQPGSTEHRTWLDECADGMYLLCEQSTWAWSAHDDAHDRTGWLTTDTANPYLDLGAGEVAATLAWTIHLHAAALQERAPGLLERVRAEVQRRIFTPFTSRRDWHWLGTSDGVNSWNPWMHSNIVAAASHLLEPSDPSRTTVLDLCTNGLAAYLDQLPSDGAIDEGVEYWWQGPYRALECLEALETAGYLGAYDQHADLLRELIAFPHRVHLAGLRFANWGDCQSRITIAQPLPAPRRAGERLGVPDAVRFADFVAAEQRPLAAHAAARIGVDRGLGRALADLRALLIHDDRVTSAPTPHHGCAPRMAGRAFALLPA